MRLVRLKAPAGFDCSVFSGGPMRVGMVDADLLDGGTRFPNLALEKMAGWLKARGHEVDLICGAHEIEGDLLVDPAAERYDVLVCSQVFTKTRRHPVLDGLIALDRVMYGGTGFAELAGPRLPNEVEHAMPDYHLYDRFIAVQPGHDRKWHDYTKASIGFTTRGCFRKCPFCVNRHYDRAVRWSPVQEFLDPTRPIVYLLDDNFMAAGHTVFFDVLGELEDCGKRFQFRQGLDVRLMTREKARALAGARWHGDFIFAFDDASPATTKAVMRGLRVWREEAPNRPTKAYVLVGFDDLGKEGVLGMWRRIWMLADVGCVPYIMRHERVKQSAFAKLYTQVARWCNQPALFKKMSFLEFCQMAGNGHAMSALAEAMPHIPAMSGYIRMKFEDFSKNFS